MAVGFDVSMSQGPGTWLCLRLAGELDIATAPKLERALRRVSQPMVVDCGALEFIDCAGLRVLIRLSKRVGAVRFENVGPMLRNVLQITGLDAIFLESSGESVRWSDGYGEADRYVDTG